MTPPSDALRLAPGHHLRVLPDARRASRDELAREVRAVAESPIVAALLEAADAILLVLNAHRQVVAFNGRGLDEATAASAVGLRPGEALGCTNARGGGCGTAPGCRSCGALGAITACGDAGRPVESECLVTREDGDALELAVRASPLRVHGAALTVVSLRDVSAEKRRDALEQLFFHDVLNTVSGLRGWAARLRRPDADHPRAADRIEHLSRQVEREIRDHRALTLAERGALVPAREQVRAADVLADAQAILASSAAARDRILEVAAVPAGAALETDPALLLRILVNMARNALEAVPEGGAVRLSCDRAAAPHPGHPDALRFSCWNDGVIPPAVQARIFQRSFSTKGDRGRGLGTWGMRLLGERYLGGEVGFESTIDCGTTFWILLPLAPIRRTPIGVN